jgi:hypothetical protein
LHTADAHARRIVLDQHTSYLRAPRPKGLACPRVWPACRFADRRGEQREDERGERRERLTLLRTLTTDVHPVWRIVILSALDTRETRRTPVSTTSTTQGAGAPQVQNAKSYLQHARHSSLNWKSGWWLVLQHRLTVMPVATSHHYTIC